MTSGAAPVVTVDGPSGSGKTTLGRRLALELALPLIDTGLLYRGVMVAAIRAGLRGDDHEALSELAARTRVEIDTDPALAAAEEDTRVDGLPAGSLLRDPRHAPLLAALSGVAGVRRALLPVQRRLAAAGAVALGRDCGTVVFPGAPVKIYLQAPETVRARRRDRQLQEAGAPVDAVTLSGEVGERDAADSGRALAPLRPAPDAHIIDTAMMGVDEMVADALRLCAARGLTARSGRRGRSSPPA